MSKNSAVMPEAPEQPQQSTVIARSGSVANQNTIRNIGLIIRREYKNRVMQRSFIISSIVILVLIIIGAFVPTVITYFSPTSNSQTKIVVVNNAGPIAGLNGAILIQYLQTKLNGAGTNTATGFALTPGTDTNTLQQQVKNGKLDILLVMDRGADQNIHFTYYTNTDDTDTTQIQTTAALLNFLDKTSRLGLTPAQTSSLFEQPTFTVVHTGQNQNTGSAGASPASYIVTLVGVVLIFMSVYLYGMTVALGVAEEKGNRIMEILVNAATPFQLLVGKIVGIGAAGLTQMSCFVLVGIGAILLQAPLLTALLGRPSGGLSIDFASVSVTLLLTLLLYFILGFALYATLFAALGALVKRQDEVQNAVQPLTLLFMVGYIASFISISTPNATWIRVMSFIPFWTPTIMLVRIGVGTMEWWEVPLSIVIMLVSILACALLAARIYRFGILLYGQRPGLRQLLRVAQTK